MYYNLTM